MSGATERRGLLQKNSYRIKMQRTGMAKTMPVRIFHFNLVRVFPKMLQKAPVPIKESGCFGSQKQK